MKRFDLWQIEALEATANMKKRSYMVRTVKTRAGEDFDVPKDEKWRFVGLDEPGAVLVFIAWKITEGDMAGIVWNCS